MPALEPEAPVSGNVSEQNALAQTDVKPLTPEERRQKMKESNMRYMFDQMIASQRRYTQDMQKLIREQQEEDARNGYSAFWFTKHENTRYSGCFWIFSVKTPFPTVRERVRYFCLETKTKMRSL